MKLTTLVAALVALVPCATIVACSSNSGDDQTAQSDSAGASGGASAGSGGTSAQTGGSAGTHTTGGSAGAGHAGTTSTGGASGHGGTATSTGGTSTATGGTSTSMGGTSTSTGGTSTSTGGTSTSAGGTSTSAGGTSTSAGGTSTSTGGTSTSAGGTSTSTGGTSTSTGGSGGSGGSGDGASCSPTISPVDTSSPTTTLSTCDEASLDAAIQTGGIITFACGTTTIPITTEHAIPRDKDITIDGGGVITLDGGGTTRLFSFDGLDFRKTTTVVTFQHITLKNGHAKGTMQFPPADPPCSQGFIDGGGGAILFRDGVLHVLDVSFQDNTGEALGPDVAGGAIWMQGALGLTVVDSHFDGNSASNGGAIGSLNSDLSIFTSSFTNNSALGMGANSVDSTMCPNGPGNQIGDGGNGGAISIDGGSDGTVTVCGAKFSKNISGALGGAMFRTPDGPGEVTDIDQSTFDANTATQGGGAFYFHNSGLGISASTISNNTAPGCGALQADSSKLNLVNDTITGNSASMKVGGAICLFGEGGVIQSCTFANDQANMGFAADLFGGTKFTINDTLFSNAMTSDEYNPLACQTTSVIGQDDLQWPMVHGKDSLPDNPCVAGITFSDPMLGALADNGGPTMTLLPAAGSPAIGAGHSCPATDQRGKPRKSDGCTIGAVEAD